MRGEVTVSLRSYALGVLCDTGTGGGQHNTVGCRAPQSPPCFLWSPLGLDAVPPSLGVRGRSCCLSSIGMHECVPNPRSHARLTLQPLTAPHLLPAQSPAAPLPPSPSSAPFLPMDPRWVCATLKPSRATVMGTAHSRQRGRCLGFTPNPNLVPWCPIAQAPSVGAAVGGGAPTNSFLPPSFGPPARPGPQPFSLGMGTPN